MNKRYREPIEDVECGGQAPSAFRWRGQRYTVTQVLGHWREDEGWWRTSEGDPLRIEQTDLWRVSARNGSRSPVARSRGAASTHGADQFEGVYELVQRGDAWRLDRVWD